VLANPDRMRSVLLVVAVVAGGTWVGIRHVPSSAAAIETVRLPAQEIQSVAIDGRGLPLAALRAVLTTHPGDAVDAARLEHDRTALEAELAAAGRLAAHVEPATLTYGSAGGAFVTFQIDQGPMFKLRSVTVRGATQREAGVLTLSAGDDAVAGRIESARHTLEETLTRRGKPSRVTVDVRTDRAAGVVDVELTSTTSR
jgi:hypothetical protein